MAELPTGTVRFLFTDIEGSTAHWEHHPEAMRVALARHDKILESGIDVCGGVVFSKMGDGMAAAFASARDALAAAVSAQQGLAEETWPELIGSVRAHGEAMDRDQAAAYARTHIAEFLADVPPETT
jgi:class 3 adenylate cyclase